jgi:predicted NUDIX family NTP pyrophosphohydrolase
MPRTSAGILAYRSTGGGLEVLLVHPGGPYWAAKDAGAWTIPKGELAPGEAPERRAVIEFHEETGFDIALESLRPLGEVRQKAGKAVIGFAAPTDIDAAACHSNTFTMEWPPRSGQMRAFPEVDKAAWFTIDAARAKINPAQAVFLDRLEQLVNRSRGAS